MKKIFYFISILLLFSTKIIAQNNWPPFYEINTDTVFQQDLNHYYWQCLVDSSGKLTIEQVIQLPVTDKFQDSVGIVKSDTAPVHCYWFRYRLKNRMTHEAKISLDATSDQVNFYIIFPNGRRADFVTGYLYPREKKDGLKNGNYIPISILAGNEIEVYQRIENKKQGIPKEHKIDIVSTEKAAQMELSTYELAYQNLYSSKFYLTAIYFGIILFAVLINFFFFLIAREKEYLYFSLLLFSLFFQGNPLFYEIFTGSHPVIASIINAGSFLYIFFFFQFVRYYFHTYRYSPKLDKLLIVISFSFIYLLIVDELSGIYPGLTNNIFSRVLFYIINTLSIVSLLLVIGFYFRKKSRANRLFLTAILPFAIFSGAAIMGYIVSQVFNLNFPAIDLWMHDWSDLLAKSTIIWMVLVFSWILFGRYDDQKREIATQLLDKERLAKEKEQERNELIEYQKVNLEKTVAERTSELKLSLDELRSTQAQLIQSEKMASLGELTAGIAHEIQNPLNFVNNFSEINKELIEELKAESLKPMSERNEQLEEEILNNLISNEEKIGHHGKRADAIVKGMLQHSRASTGQMENTYINALADEYLRLSYQGLRARDKTLNATLETDFDPSTGEVNIISQDIGRVLLNLYNNAFYAVTQKKKRQLEVYEPRVSVSTRRISGKVEIRVKDNGNGIPQKLKDKIFQPFFTTKPTGQGTGLGLSLSYDIIKAHGGEIKVETREGEFTEFVIQIPSG